MKILWVTPNFLHPTTKGGQIRTLEILRELHRRHEIHFAAIPDPAHPEALEKSREYCSRAYPLQHTVRDKNSLAFAGQLGIGLFSSVPLAVSRFSSPPMRRFLEDLLRRERFDVAVADFLVVSSFFPAVERSFLFQHNVETMIWRRHAQHASNPLRRFYFRLQAERMYRYEKRVTRSAGHTIAVSAADSRVMRDLFGVECISEVPTGVNIDFFAPPATLPPRVADLVFVGSMDWLPNVDGVTYFVREILPLIRLRRPACSLAIVGRTPSQALSRLASEDPNILVTGTVPDVRPYLWGSSVSVVPLRIGGGTRLKIYEAMAARVPVISTTVGAEGLSVNPGEDIRITDDPQSFAEHCLELLEDTAERQRLARAAWEMVSSRFSWDHVSRCFERILEHGPRLN